MNPLLLVEAPERHEIIAGFAHEREVLRIDAVVGRCDVAETGVAVGVADRAVETALRGRIVRSEDERRRESVNRRQQRRRLRRQRIRQRFPVEAVVNQVELARAFEQGGVVEGGGDFAVAVRIFAQTDGNDAETRRPRVREFPLAAKSVTSRPRATIPSARLLATCSQGP